MCDQGKDDMSQDQNRFGNVKYLADIQVGLVAAAPPRVGRGIRSVVAGAGVCNLDLHGS